MDAKAKNLKKQKRFHARHPGYAKKYVQRARERKFANPPAVKPRALIGANLEPFRTYELFDPRDPEKLPHLIGVCPVNTKPVWALLWACRNHSNARWARWFRNLEKIELEPVERTDWVVGRFIPLKYTTAIQLADIRIKQVCEAVGYPPKWLYSAPRKLTKGHRIGCVRPDGRVLRFSTFACAEQEFGAGDLSKHLQTSSPANDGSIWFDDGD